MKYGHWIPDVLAAFGLALLGYGLYLREPWIAFATVGAILTLVSIFLTISQIKPK